ncbi:MAG TPA: hypothetical protein VGQ49_11180 [Bryobacteraceae bacterium]|jgi:hypothetical protein|nr:hypothetical protein [Bryobacteraceae bacterium]
MKLSKQTMDFINSPERSVNEVPDELFVQGRFCPKAFKPIDLIKGYKLTRKVKCIFGHDHQKGFIVLFEGDNYGAMGPECAEEIFGEARCSQLQSNFRKLVNQEKTEATIRPNLLRNNALMQLLPNLCDVAKDKDAFFGPLYGKAPEFVKKLKTAALSAGFGAPTIDYDTLFNVNHAFGHLKNSSELYSIRPVLESNTAKAERHYSDAKRIIGAVREDLAAGKTFFLPAAIGTFLRYIDADPVWKGRVEMMGGGLRVDDHIFAVPIHIPATLDALEGTIAEIKSILDMPLSEFKAAA